MDSFFSRGFKASKCKTLVKLAMARIKLLRNKRDIQVKQMRREIANLLQTGQEPSARIRVEHIVREQNILAAYEIIELFCELIVVRLPIIESQRQCPLDLKEAIASLIFAAPRCADLPELLEVRGLFGVKYGKEFVAAAGELRPECGVNRRVIEKLSVRAPSGETKLKLLKEIAAEHNVEWDPSNSEAELLKAPEDLLEGPSQFLASSEVPLSQSFKKEAYTQEEQISLKTKEDVEITPKPATAPLQTVSSISSLKPPLIFSDEEKQFIPFVPNIPGKLPPAGKYDSPPKFAPIFPPSRSDDVAVSTHRGSGDSASVGDDPYSIARRTGKMDYSAKASATQGESAGSSIDEMTMNSLKHTKGGTVEYADIASAAQAAAESAERAAAAARAAASLAKNEFTMSRSFEKANTATGDSSSDSENDNYVQNPNSLLKEKYGEDGSNLTLSMEKNAVLKASKPRFDEYKPQFDEYNAYDEPDILDAKVFREARAEKQDTIGGRSSYKNNVKHSDKLNFSSQLDLPARYDDRFELEKVPKQHSPEEPKLNLNFFSAKRGLRSLDDADNPSSDGSSEFQTGKIKSLFSNNRRVSKTKPPTDFENVGDEGKNIVGQSSPYTSRNVPFHSMHSECSKSRGSQDDRPSYDSPPSSIPSLTLHFDDSPTDANIFPGNSGDSQGFTSPSTVSQPPRRPPPGVPKLNSLLRKDSDASHSSSGTNSPSAPPVHPKLPDYDDLASRFLALKSNRS